MVTITLLCVGKLKESYLRDACKEYEKRLGAFCKLNIVEVLEERMPEHPSPAQTAQVIQAEGQRLLQKIPKGAYVYSLCIEGGQRPSEAFAQELSVLQVEGKSHVVFLIGGSCGLSREVKETSDVRFSMSQMTFPHQLARVMLLEQVYRAFQISSGGKYHK